MREHAGRLQLPLAPLVALILIATLSIDFLSAYIRHTEAGLGCRDWPACYGQIGASIASVEQPGIARHALAPDPLAKRAHRLLATGLVVMVLLLLHRSRQHGALAGFEAQIPLLMAALLLLLAVIGPASYLKTRPAIAACNLLGGMALAALSWRLLLGLRGKRADRIQPAAATRDAHRAGAARAAAGARRLGQREFRGPGLQRPARLHGAGERGHGLRARGILVFPRTGARRRRSRARDHGNGGNPRRAPRRCLPRRIRAACRGSAGAARARAP